MKDGTDIQMFPYRVAIKPLLCLLLWSATFANLVSAQNNFKYSRELAQFVPECASNCFVTFLNSHFSQVPCDDSTLDCLCTSRGAGGFTVGEGAVQCLEAEQQVGLCRNVVLRDDAAQIAYFMCSDERNAVQPTHTALEATFVRTGTAGGVILAPPATDPPTSTTSTRPLPTTLVTATNSFTFSPTPGPFETQTTASTSTLQSPPTAEPEESQSTSPESSDEGFGTRQIIGLAVGVSGAIGLLLAAFLFARCRRKKRLDAAGPLTVLEKPSPDRRWKQNERSIIHISPPLPGRSPAISPHPVVGPRRTMWPDTIGMALSRPQSGATSTIPSPHYRRASKLLPPKPTASRPFLTVDIPQIKLTDSPPERQQPMPSNGYGAQSSMQAQASIAAAEPSLPPPVRRSDRNSTMTEFEEDGIISAYVTSQPTSQIWRPPQSDPRSATTYYVADGSGNWVLGRPDLPSQTSAAVELEASTAAHKEPSVPLINTIVASQAGIGHGKGSPIAPSAPQGPTRPAAAASLLPAANIQSANGKPMSRSSSVYSSDKQTQKAKAGTVAAHNVPAMSFSHPEPPRRRSNSVNHGKGHERGESQDGLLRHESYKSHGSKDSVTTFASSVGDGEDEPGRILDQTNLSPVVESPEAIAEQYHRQSQAQSHMYGLGLQVRPPPVRPGHISPPIQPSPLEGPRGFQHNQAIGANLPPRYPPGMTQPENRECRDPYSSMPRRPDPSQFKTGSPGLPTMRIVPPSHTSSLTSPYPSPLRPQRPPMQRGPAPYPQPPRNYTQAQRPGPPAGGQQPQYSAYRPQAAGIHQALWGPGPSVPDQSQFGPQEQSWRPPAVRQPRPDEHLGSLQHQLRQPNIQRDGPYPQHIASQQMRPRMPMSGHSGGSASWSSTSSSLAAKRIGSERAAALAVQTNGGRSSDPRWRQQGSGGLSSDGQTLAPPQSAGWQPRLTPTRRGDDLYLHIQ